MSNFINRLWGTTKKYTVWDFGFIIFYMLSLGIIVGVYLYSFFSMYMPIVWVIFVASLAWVVYKTFFKYWK